MTVADIVACKTSTVKSGGHCPAGSHVLIVSVNSKDYALSRGHKPFGMGNQPGMGTYNQVCAGTTGKASLPAAQAAFFGDLVEINIVENGANGYLTAAYANETAASAIYTSAQILATVTPVTNATTMALRDLTALLPVVPANMTTAAQTLSSVLSKARQLYQVTAVSNRPEIALPNAAEMNVADAEVLTSELKIDVSDERDLITDAEHSYVRALEKDYSSS